MKKISILVLIMVILLLLPSCGADTPKETDEVTEKAEVPTPDTEADTADGESEGDETAEEPNDSLANIFATVPVIGAGYATANSGDTVFAVEADSFISSKPSVATIEKTDDGNYIRAGQAGVTLIAYLDEGEWKAVAICVLSDLDVLDRTSSYDAQVFEKGESFMLTAPVSGAEYITSDEAVADVLAAPQISFKECGYACVTLASASRPFSYSFVVYDRITE